MIHIMCWIKASRIWLIQHDSIQSLAVWNPNSFPQIPTYTTNIDRTSLFLLEYAFSVHPFMHFLSVQDCLNFKTTQCNNILFHWIKWESIKLESPLFSAMKNSSPKAQKKPHPHCLTLSMVTQSVRAIAHTGAKDLHGCQSKHRSCRSCGSFW